MKKKLLSLFLASAMVVSIAACGNNGVTTNNAPENTGSTNEEVGDSSQEGSEQGGTKPTTPSGQLVIFFYMNKGTALSSLRKKESLSIIPLL